MILGAPDDPPWTECVRMPVSKLKIFKDKRYGWSVLALQIDNEEDLRSIRQFYSYAKMGEWFRVDCEEGYECMSDENLRKHYDEVKE